MIPPLLIQCDTYGRYFGFFVDYNSSSFEKNVKIVKMDVVIGVQTLISLIYMYEFQ